MQCGVQRDDMCAEESGNRWRGISGDIVPIAAGDGQLRSECPRGGRRLTLSGESVADLLVVEADDKADYGADLRSVFTTASH
jgi:hypothetical protein